MDFQNHLKDIICTFENSENAENLFGKVNSRTVLELLIDVIEILILVAKKKKAVSKELKFWFSEDHVCFLYIRPASSHMTIVPAYMGMDSISSAAQRYGLSLELKPDSNPEDQFDVQIHIDENWLENNDRKAFLSFFQKEIVDAVERGKITLRQ